MNSKIFTLLILLITQYPFLQYAKAQGMGWEWAQSFLPRYIGFEFTLGDPYVSSNSIINDDQGNIFIAGAFSDSISIGGIKLIGNGPYIYKCDSNGTAIWAKATSTNGSGGNGGITIDENGNIYVFGGFTSSSITFDGITLNNYNADGYYDFFIVKYDPSGNVIWAKSGGGNYDDHASGIAIDNSGNAYVSGAFQSSSITFGSFVFTNSSTGNKFDCFLTKYDSNGNIVWAKQIGGSGDEDVNVSVSSSDIIYVAGFYSSPSITVGPFILTNAGGGGTDVFLAQYDPSGIAIWAKKAGSSADDYAIAILPDASGNTYIAGSFSSLSIAFGSTTLNNANTNIVKLTSDIFLTKYDANGNVLWAQNFGGTGDEHIHGIATNDGDNIFFTGTFTSSILNVGSFSLFNNTNNTYFDAFLSKFTSSGNAVYATSIGGSKFDWAYDVCADISGNTYIKGRFGSPSITFGDTTLTNPGSSIEFIAKYGIGAVTPTFTPDGGIYLTPPKVTVSCATSGATIHYTTNGVDPTENDPIVSSGSSVTIGPGMIQLKARAFKSGKVPSVVKSSVYQVGNRAFCGNTHSLAIRSDSSLWTWGKNTNGQLGDGTTNQKTVPGQLTGISGVGDAAGGLSHTVALKGNGTVWTWGLNNDGQLGDGTINQQTAPVHVTAISDVVNVTAGNYHTLALKSDGTVWAWGRNSGGQLGNGDITGSLVPVNVNNLSGVIDIGAGEAYSLALKNDGTVWAWGYNSFGQLGNGNTWQEDTPVQVIGLTEVIAIAAGWQHCLALKSDGTVWAWGYNGSGQLGNGKTNNPPANHTPIRVAYGNIAIAAGANHSLSVSSDGKVLAWGYNGQGQLGDNTTQISRNLPTEVKALSGINSISCGSHSLAVTPIDEVDLFWAWGSNSNGQLGESTTTDRSLRELVHFPTDENDNGIDDYEDYEMINNINSLTDTDLDGLANWKEMMVYGTDPNTFDMNKDGLADGVNIFTGLSPISNDTDGDSIPNTQEIRQGTSPVLYDSDGDLVSDAEDSFPLDPKRQTLPFPNLGDHIPPVITILEPQ